MKKIVLALIVGSALITSCGSNKSFNKKRHSHRNWVKVGEYTDSEFAQKEATDKDKEEVAIATVDVDVKEEAVQEELVVVTDVKTESAAKPEKVVAEAPKPAVRKEKQRKSTETAAITEDVVIAQEIAEPTVVESETTIVNAEQQRVPKDTKSPMATTNTLLLVIIAILIPPLAVALYEGITNRFWISLILTLLLFLPGMIYALLVVTGTI